MKKAFVLTLALAAGVAAFAQNMTLGKGTAKGVAKFPVSMTANKTQQVDTLTFANNINPLADTMFSYSWGGTNWGTVTGTNSLGMFGWAERYDLVGIDTAYALEVIVPLAGKVSATSTDSMSCFIASDSFDVVDTWEGPYSDTTMFTWDNQIHFSSFSMTGVNPITSPSFYAAVFLNPYAVATVTDTIELFVAKDGTRPADDTMNVGRNIYFRVNAQGAVVNGDIYGIVGLRTNLWIFPVITFDTTTQVGIDKGVAKNGLLFSGIYPNPATDFSKVRFSLNTAADVTIKIFDIKGVEVMSLEKGRMSAGAHEEILDVTALPAGVYSVGVSNGSAIIGGRLTVSK